MKELYWGYLDDSGVIHVKQYVDDKTIQNYEQLPFCKGIFDPFYAKSLHQAQQKIMKFLDSESHL